MSDSLRGKCVIAGIGHTGFGKLGRSVTSLAVEACRSALEDAGVEKEACGTAMRMSVAISSVVPPPMQNPFTAAITGFQTSMPRLRVWPFCVRKNCHSSFCRPIMDFRSAPAVNERSPPSVTMAQRTSGSSRTRIQASDSAA